MLTLQCGNCKQVLSSSKFAKHKVKKMLLKGGKLWCRKCCRNRVKDTLARVKEKQARRKNESWGAGKVKRWENLYAKVKAKATAASAKRRCLQLHATPSWADLREISSVYAEAQRLTQKTGVLHHVDHIVPLQGKNVCGLHVSWNLRAIPAIENLAKSNKF